MKLTWVCIWVFGTVEPSELLGGGLCKELTGKGTNLNTPGRQKVASLSVTERHSGNTEIGN